MVPSYVLGITLVKSKPHLRDCSQIVNQINDLCECLLKDRPNKTYCISQSSLEINFAYSDADNDRIDPPRRQNRKNNRNSIGCICYD